MASVAAKLVAEPALLVATARYRNPLSANVTLVTVSVVVVTPPYGAAFVRSLHVMPPSVDTCHWNPGGGLPLAATVNDAFAPAATVWLIGFVVNEGASNTLSAAALLIAEATPFVTMTRY